MCKKKKEEFSLGSTWFLKARMNDVVSEIIINVVTICVGFHASHWKCFKYFYQIVSM
jgi:hypothetical protein